MVAIYVYIYHEVDSGYKESKRPPRLYVPYEEDIVRPTTWGGEGKEWRETIWNRINLIWRIKFNRINLI